LGKVTKMGDFVGVEDAAAAPCRIFIYKYDVVDCIIVGVCVCMFVHVCEDIGIDVNT
jgi:hypothetical protein